MNYNHAIFILILSSLFYCVPALGAEQYRGGTPEITAHIGGINEFSAGQNAIITVIIQNSGTASEKFTGRGTLNHEDLPTTAKLVAADLSSGNAPVAIKTGTHMLGDIRSPGTTTVLFPVKITSDATSGNYTLLLNIRYMYLSNSLSNQPQSDLIQDQFSPVNRTIPIIIRIKPEIRIRVLNIETNGLAEGTEGYLNLTVKNIATGNGTDATIRLIRSGDSAILPVDDSVFIGNFPAGGTITCRYKVAASADAIPQTYPVDIVVVSTNEEGATVTSAVETAGIPVIGKPGFTIVSIPPVIAPGESLVFDVGYQNTGTITVHDAEARISADDPLSGQSTRAYLGDIPPGGIATAQFTIHAANTADPGGYTLNTEVSYRDLFDHNQVSDTVRIPVTVAASSFSIKFLQNPIALALILVILAICAGYALSRWRKKDR